MVKRRSLAFSLVVWILLGLVPAQGAPSLESLLPKDGPEGWSLIEGPRIYNKKTLFEHIDGQAELFLKYGFLRSAFGVYQEKVNPPNQIELDIYDMGNVLQAFGIFSRFRGEHRPMGIGLDSYSDDRSALFYKGKYFVMLYATESNPSILKEFSTRISVQIQDPSLPPKEIGYFPEEGLQPGSIQYFPEGLLGHRFLKKGFLGRYMEEKVGVQDEKKAGKVKSEGKEFRLFLAIFEGPESAGKALKAYREELSKKGKIHSFQAALLKGEDPYQGRVIVARMGSYLLGAIGFEKEKNGEELLGKFMKRTR
jgi:hypothetical protein